MYYKYHYNLQRITTFVPSIFFSYNSIRKVLHKDKTCFIIKKKIINQLFMYKIEFY